MKTANQPPAPSIPTAKNGKVLINFWVDIKTYHRLRKLPTNRSQFLRQSINTCLPKFEQEAKEYYSTLNPQPNE